MKSRSNTAISLRNCGKCGKTIKMRGHTKLLLCTAILGVVDADFKEVCEHYEERIESAARPFSKRS